MPWSVRRLAASLAMCADMAESWSRIEVLAAGGQLSLRAGGQRRQRPVGLDALFGDAQLVGQEAPAEQRMRPRRAQRDLVVVADRHDRQALRAIEHELHFHTVQIGELALARIGQRRQQRVHALAVAGQRQRPRLQRQRHAVGAQIGRTDQSAHVLDADQQRRLAIAATLDRGVVEVVELRLELRMPAIHLHLDQNDAALRRLQLAADRQAPRRLQVVAGFGFALDAALALGIDHRDIAHLGPRHHPQRTEQALLAGLALRHPLHQFVAVALAVLHGAADHQQRDQQQQDQSADGGESQDQLQGCHRRSSVMEDARVPPLRVRDLRRS
ncbi:hypothetical protein NZ30_07790 [Xanthomonas translucens pv. undulosa]|nr:hypothetical protein NZ30_07790 [Xanthomonas translucens pv. undulosa]